MHIKDCRLFLWIFWVVFFYVAKLPVNCGLSLSTIRVEEILFLLVWRQISPFLLPGFYFLWVQLRFFLPIWMFDCMCLCKPQDYFWNASLMLQWLKYYQHPTDLSRADTVLIHHGAWIIEAVHLFSSLSDNACSVCYFHFSHDLCLPRHWAINWWYGCWNAHQFSQIAVKTFSGLLDEFCIPCLDFR